MVCMDAVGMVSSWKEVLSTHIYKNSLIFSRDAISPISTSWFSENYRESYPALSSVQEGLLVYVAR